MELTAVLMPSRRLRRYLLRLALAAPPPAPVKTPRAPLFGRCVLGTVLMRLGRAGCSVTVSRRKAEVPASRTEPKSRKRSAHEEPAAVVGVRGIKVTAQIVASRALEGTGTGVEGTSPVHVFGVVWRVTGFTASFALPAEAQFVFRELIFTRWSRGCTLTVWVGLTSVS